MSLLEQVHELIDVCDELVEEAVSGAERAEVTLAKRHFEDAVNRLQRAQGLNAQAKAFEVPE